jgi:hypothetical protein
MMSNRRNKLLFIICLTLIALSTTAINAQSKKQKARVSVQFNKIDDLKFLKITAKFKEGKKYKPAAELDFKIYSEFENDSLVYLGDLVLNNKGSGEFDLSKAFESIQDQYTFKLVHKESANFKKVSKRKTIKLANLSAKLKFEDEKPIIIAQLIDIDNTPIESAGLKVNLQRLFAPLTVGEEVYFTDENGMINVPIIERMPGVYGKLNYEVILEDSDDYGTIKSIVPSDIGEPIKDLSTFDQRTMWSPPSKTPKFLLIVPNLIIVGVWTYLFILVFNLFRISKHNNF